MVVKAQEERTPEDQPGFTQKTAVELRLPESAHSGEKVHVLSTFTPDDFPPSVYKKISITWLDRPQGPEPEVLTGVPETDITFTVPGNYTADVEAGLLVKGSCGAIAYHSLLIRRMVVVVE